MIGLIKLCRKKGMISKCGFKYIKFNGDMEILAERNIIRVGTSIKKFSGDKIYISFDENSIVSESMSALTISHFSVLNRKECSGYCYPTSGFRNIITDENFNLAPIIFRKTSGQRSERSDTFAYSESNYIKFHSEWKQDSDIKSIETSLKDPNEDELWSKLEECKPELFERLKQTTQSESNLNVALVNQTDENRSHLNRFNMKYGDMVLMNHDIDLSDFNTMDVIDLVTIGRVKIDEPEKLDNYQVFEISTSTVVNKGRGLDTEKLELEDHKFYYMAITDCIYHRINAREKPVTLVLNTDNTSPHKDLVFLKFNKNGLTEFWKNVIMDKLT